MITYVQIVIIQGINIINTININLHRSVDKE